MDLILKSHFSVKIAQFLLLNIISIIKSIVYMSFEYYTLWYWGTIQNFQYGLDKMSAEL